MRFLNEVMCDFDELLERYDFAHVEKIKVSEKLEEQRKLRLLPNERYKLHFLNFHAKYSV